MLKSVLSYIILTVIPIFAFAQKNDWKIEAEDGQGSVQWKDGTCTIDAPKGLTLWNKHLMKGNTTITYEARIVEDSKYKTEAGAPRISDLNCFVMATPPSGSVGKVSGRFVDYYSTSMYYVGYGGNWNTTTRFRRYTGDKRGIDSAQYRPIVLKEYTDAQHLLIPNHWYNIRIDVIDGRFRYYIDGELLVDYVDVVPLKQGYFGFRTTLSHAEMRNFKYTCEDVDSQPIVVKRIGGDNSFAGVTTFGVPFDKGEKKDNNFTIKTPQGKELHYSSWRLASWPDGSTKWQAFCAEVPANCDSLLIVAPHSPKGATIQSATHKKPRACTPPSGVGGLSFYVTLNNQVQPVLSTSCESTDNMRTVTKFTGKNFIIRTYQYTGSNQMKMVHTLLVDSVLNKDGLHELSIHFKVPMHGEAYKRFVQFDDEKSMSVQPLISRRRIDLEAMDSVTKSMLQNIAKWDGFRLSQLSANGYSIRKRATSISPWIGTQEGHRSNGLITIGDSTSQTSFLLKDFWQSYPSTLQVDKARSDTAIVTISLYSPEAEPYSFAHYDTIPHTLEAAYEDVQSGMSTAWGIGRTSTIYIMTLPQPLPLKGRGEGYYLTDSKSACPSNILPSLLMGGAGGESVFCCTPSYLHKKRAFGIWSLPTIEDSRDSLIESSLNNIMSFYEKEIDRNSWYGFFNYGDIMHSYDASRDEWRYDVGGFAWDNTELGSPAMFWYMFLRTGDPKIFRMAEAMTRHCSEVDTYHFGPHAGLGSRHNVTHWGCGAKEARISEAWWNRFYYYLTADERLGDIMHEVVDADTLLYHLDPMRLAQPRSMYPCSAPARLRIGPDWLAYASNWFTEYERTISTSGHVSSGSAARNPISLLLSGMTSIANLPHGFFQGPLALGYDPATGVISTDLPDELSTNHLMPIMGGFELMNEMQMSIDCPPFWQAWLYHNKEYKENALRIRKNKFRIPRLGAYAGWRLGDEWQKSVAWHDLLDNIPLSTHPHKANEGHIWTNDCATWTLDAIFLKETIRK